MKLAIGFYTHKNAVSVPVRRWLPGIWLLGLISIQSTYAGAPIEVEVSLEQSALKIGAPMVLEMQVTNTSSETLGPFFLHSSEFSLLGRQLEVSESCDLFFAVPGAESGNAFNFSFSWRISELQPGESVVCRASWETRRIGDETVNLSAFFEGVRWELGEFSYAVLSELPPPVPVPVNSRVWLILAALMLLLMGCWRLRLP